MRHVPKYTEAQMRAALLAERRKCWDAINRLIKPGPLSGNGFDQVAERNGLVLASNAISFETPEILAA